MTGMWTRQQWHRFLDRPVVEWTIFVVGVIFMILSVPVGILPGPGGIFVFAIGLAMVLKTSMWAKRHYVRFKRWQPKAGHWADWGLRRQSAKRREVIRKDRAAVGSLPPTEEAHGDELTGLVPAPPSSAPEVPGDRE